MGVLGYIAFNEVMRAERDRTGRIGANVVLHFHDNDPAVKLARAAVAASLTLSVPIICHPGRNALAGGRKLGLGGRVGVTAVFLSLALALALTLDLAAVLTLLGSSLGMLLAYISPATIWLTMPVWQRREVFATGQDARLTRLAKFVLVTGTVLGCGSLAVSVDQAFFN